MKRLPFILACALALGVVGPALASARIHLWPHHSKSKSTDASKSKSKQPKAKREKHSSDTEPLYSLPNSVGWWHKGPGPAGAGAK